MPPRDPRGDEGAARQLAWYRDTVKWLAAIAAGAVLLGLDWVFDRRLSDLGRGLFTAAAGLLVFAGGAGVFAMFKFADYASSGGASDRRGANRWFWLTFAPAFLGLVLMVAAGLMAVWSRPPGAAPPPADPAPAAAPPPVMPGAGPRPDPPT